MHNPKIFFNRPLAMMASAAQTLSSDGPPVPPKNAEKQGSVATIKVHGPLVHREAETSVIGFQSYEGISRQLSAALADQSVSEILLDIDSPGGQVSGAFDLADEIFEAGKVKPITAHVTALAASAGYLLASQASKIVATESSDVGSVGVITVHMSQAQMLQNIGLKPTIISAGATKADASPITDLSARAKEELQNKINQSMDMLVTKIARGRASATGQGMAAISNMLRTTEGRIYNADIALGLGLIDAVGKADMTTMTNNGTAANGVNQGAIASAKAYAAARRGETVTMSAPAVAPHAPAATGADAGALASAKAWAAARRGTNRI